MMGRFPRSDVTAEVRRRRCTVDFVCENCQFVVDSMTNRKPMELFQERLSRRSFRHLENDTSCYVLDVVDWGSMQHSVTVVQAR